MSKANSSISENNSSVDAQLEKDPEVSEVPRKKGRDFKSILKDFLSPTCLVSIFSAILLGYFGISYQQCNDNENLNENLEVTIQPPSEKRTLDYLLADKVSVENQGGIVHGGRFEEGGCGTKGFISVENRDVIFFPIPPKFTSLYEGTVTFCVTLKGPLRNSFSLFRVHEVEEKDPNISLKVVSGADGQRSRLRLRGNTRAEKEVLVSKEQLDWQINDHYHIAGTWGPIGMRLYVDGELVGKAERAIEDVISSPIDFKDGTFVINNYSPELDECNHPTNCIISNLQISNYQLSGEKIKENYAKLYPED